MTPIPHVSVADAPECWPASGLVVIEAGAIRVIVDVVKRSVTVYGGGPSGPFRITRKRWPELPAVGHGWTVRVYGGRQAGWIDLDLDDVVSYRSVRIGV